LTAAIEAGEVLADRGYDTDAVVSAVNILENQLIIPGKNRTLTGLMTAIYTQQV
jgi:hypothetical protein